MMENQDEFESTGDDQLDAYIQYKEQSTEPENPVAHSFDIDQPDYSYLDDIGDDEDEAKIREFYGHEGVSNYRQAELKSIDQNKANSYYNYILEQTNNPNVAAALVGNMMKESGGNYRAIHDNGTGYGLFGHRLDRKKYLLNEIAQSNKPEDIAQIDAAIKELRNSYSSTYHRVANARNIDEATITLMNEWERPNAKYADAKSRVMYARSVIKQWGGYSKIPQTPALQDSVIDPTNNQISKVASNAVSNSGIVVAPEPASAVPEAQVAQAVGDKVASTVDFVHNTLDTIDKVKGVAGQAISGILDGVQIASTSRQNFLNEYKNLQKLSEERASDYDTLTGQNKEKTTWI